jgi:hypothetical protein
MVANQRLPDPARSKTKLIQNLSTQFTWRVMSASRTFMKEYFVFFPIKLNSFVILYYDHEEQAKERINVLLIYSVGVIFEYYQTSFSFLRLHRFYLCLVQNQREQMLKSACYTTKILL